MSVLKKYTCTIVCPLYTSNLDEQYIAAINNNIKVLSDFKFVFLIGEDFNQKFISKYFKGDYEIVVIDFHYFKSIDSYNQLLTSKYFWSLFDSDYILICQHDTYVFKDELNYWCNQGYAYIGAPVFRGFTKARLGANPLSMQNGGFSLRSVKKALDTLYSLSCRRSIIKALFKSLFKGNLRMVNYILKHSVGKLKMNEDYFWCTLAPFLNEDFNLCGYEQSMKFSFEVNPERLFKENGSKLPFGCHAWDRYSKEFWKEHINLLD